MDTDGLFAFQNGVHREETQTPLDHVWVVPHRDIRFPRHPVTRRGQGVGASAQLSMPDIWISHVDAYRYLGSIAEGTKATTRVTVPFLFGSAASHPSSRRFLSPRT